VTAGFARKSASVNVKFSHFLDDYDQVQARLFLNARCLLDI